VNILLLTQWFDPEPCLKGLAFARALQRQGHEVSVLTGFPNYPSGKIYPGYRQRWRTQELIEGISVTRVPLYPSHDRSAARRMLNYVSFALSSLVGIVLLPRPDVVYVYAPPPSAALGAVALKLLRKVPFLIDVQDLWPDALGATGMVRSNALLAVIRWWVALVHRHAARIIVLSNGFRRTLIERGEAPDRVIVIRNWTHEDSPAAGAPAATAPADRFDIVFAGNMGPAQDLGVVLDAAALLKEEAPQVRFILVGDGVEAAELADAARARALDNVTFPGRLPTDAMPGVFAAADALLVHLRNEPVFAITIPSKTQAYLQAGKPILMGVPGDAAELVTEAGAGLAFEPGNPAALAAAVRRLMAMPAEERLAMGRAGARFYRDHLSLEVGTRAFVQFFEQAVTDARH